IGIGTFIRSCLGAGLVSTMMKIARREWPGRNVPRARVISQYRALQLLCILVQLGDESECQTMLDDLLKQDVLNICLQCMQHQLCVMRLLSISALRSLCQVYLGEKVPSSLAAAIIEGVCLYTLQGPDHVVNQLLNPVTAWQSTMFSEMIERTQVTRESAPIFYAVVQDTAVQVAHELLFTSLSPKTTMFCYEILKERPQVLDLLLNCAILDRPSCFPESNVASTASKTLVLLLQWPSHIVPGVALSVNEAFKESECDVVFKAIGIFTSRPNWAEMLIEVWMNVQEEDVDAMERLVFRPCRGVTIELTIARRFSIEGTEKGMMANFLRNRGIRRASILRLIATITHAATSCGTNAQIESVLHIAYLGCCKGGKYLEDCTTDEEVMRSFEYEYEVFRSYLLENAKPSKPVVSTETPFVIASQRVLGPTALVRLLAVLAQRKTLSPIQTLSKLPNGLSSSTSLQHIQQITHPEVIRRIIRLSQMRIVERMDRGRTRARAKGDPDETNFACSTFMSVAELAAALVALDEYTHGVYSAEIRGARKQLVIALGNASQMAYSLGHFKRALHLASGATAAAENIAVEEGLTPAIIEKNEGRVAQANAALRIHQ
ncbi:hypothetical protein CONPUDRAFT_60632, partial [Coniophora puteana RWD-64-598 SS2]